jgi:hypothetical protein
MTKTPGIPDMINQSMEVLSKRDVPTFEKYENQGTVREAIIYVGLAAVLSGLLGLGGGIGGFLNGIITTILGFLVFTYVIYYFGKTQGGSGSFDQVAYSFALFWAPLAVVFGAIVLVLTVTLIGLIFVPFVAIAAIAANVYFAYMAVQSSMNMHDSSKIWITLVVAFFATIVAQLIVSGLLR